MNRTYDLFEKMPNGEVLWCGSVSGLEAARSELAALAGRNGNEYVLMHVLTSEIMEGQMSQPKFPTTKQIEKRAYELYLERGCEDGRDLEDWLAAQSELTELSEQSSPKPKARPAGAGK